MRWSHALLWGLFVGLLLATSLLNTSTDAHRSGCHRWHSCPSDRGTYTCGDLGYCSQCPDNQFCLAGKPRTLPAPPPTPGTQPPSRVVQEFSGKVVGVTDGDTITVMHNSLGEKVRLNGIDCPEKRQAFGSRAKQAASELMFGKTITVQVKDIDRYKRTVGDVILADGRVVNVELVSMGMCWWYRKYAPNNEQLAQAEEEARSHKRGLWSDPSPVAPWEWRAARKRYR